MYKVIHLTLIACFFVIGSHSAEAQWIELSKALDERNIQAVAVDPTAPQTLFAHSDKIVYKTTDGGQKWEEILKTRGSENYIHALFVDYVNVSKIYAGTDHGLQVSQNGGGKWAALFKGQDEESKRVFCVQRDTNGVLWVGTGKGLFQSDQSLRSFSKVTGVPQCKIYSLWIHELSASQRFILALTEKGIYKSDQTFSRWQRMRNAYSSDETEAPENQSLNQFSVESMPSLFAGPNIIYSNETRQFFAATSKGVASSRDGELWEDLDLSSLPVKNVRCLAESNGIVYAATEKGVYQYVPDTKTFRELEEIPATKNVRWLSYQTYGDALVAATDRGVFRLLLPEIQIPRNLSPELSKPDAQDLLAAFKNEPSVLEIQSSAIRYAEVHPSKIAEWRAGAAKKALFPTLSIRRDLNNDQNIDIDRGGTGDADHFIEGPTESSQDWSIGVSWDLGDIVWNDAQTSIDTRSKLMAELRGDILHEVTHLYYQRRRLQIEILLSESRELKPMDRLDKELKLQELTASIDALTGGYLTRALSSKNQPS